MKIEDIQREKLTDAFKKEALRRGIILNPFDIDDFLNEVFNTPGRSAGMPIAQPVIQSPREHFRADDYNKFLQEIDFDFDVLFSFLKRNRLSSRNLLVYNDVEMRGLTNRLDKIAAEIDAFFQEAEEVNNSKFNQVKKSISFRDAEYVNSAGTQKLFVNSDAGVLTLNPQLTQSRDMDMSFLEGVTEAVQVGLPSNTVTFRREPASLLNLASTDANPWLLELTTNDAPEFATVKLEIPLPQLEELNKIAISPIPGATYELTVETAVANNSFINVGYSPAFTQKAIFYFKPDTIDRIRLTLKTARTTSNEPTTSQFVFGLTSLELGRTVFDSTGSIIVKDIDPGIDNRPILSVSMKANQILPNNTNSQYYIALNDKNATNPSNRIEGVENKDNENLVEFSITQEINSPKTTVLRLDDDTVINRNAVKFKSLFFPDLSALSTTSTTYLPKLTDLWLGQNVFKTDDLSDFEKIQIEDAIVKFDEVNELSDVRLPMQLVGRALSKDAGGTFLSLPLPVAFNTKYEGTVGDATDIKGLMKTEENIGVFKITVYKSRAPDSPSIITPLVVNIVDNKVYIIGTYDYDDLFSIDYLAKLTNDVILTKGSVKLHNGYGRAGLEPDNQIPLSSGKYQINYDTNQLFSIDTSITGVNGKKYLSLEGIFDTAKLKVFEAYIYVDKTHVVINLDRTLQIDQEAGEYIIIRHLDSKNSIRLDNSAEIRDLRQGWHFLSVVSKPFTNSPSAIKTLLSVKDLPGVVGVDPARIFSLNSSRYISKLGVWDKANVYVEKEVLFNQTKRVGPDTYSSLIRDDTLVFMAPDIGYELLSADSVNNDGDVAVGQESAIINLPYFPDNLFKDDVHSKINIKIDLENTSGPSSVLETPSVIDLQLSIKYL